MSKNVSIEEGERARNFGPTVKIKTELQGSGSCYWVPEDERQTGHVFASENRVYTADEIGKYGIGEIDINIIFTGIGPDGIPWDAYIDPNTGLPVIEYPDSNIEMIIDPETGDIVIKPIDDTTPIAVIDNSTLDEMGFDPTSDLDMSLDDLGDVGDLGNLTISDGDMSVDLDLDTGEWDTGDCPASIQIMHAPNKTEYTDGLAIDYDGLVVQAFDKDGNVWRSSEYPDGYIPAHKLNTTKYADMSASKEIAGISDDYDKITQDQINKIASPESVANMFSDDFPGVLSSIGASKIQSKFEQASAGKPFYYAWCDGGLEFGPGGGSIITFSGMWCGIVVPIVQTGYSLYCSVTAWDVNCYYNPNGAGSYFSLINEHQFTADYPLFAGSYPMGNSSLKSSINADTSNVQSVDVNFTSPCLADLNATFDISVTPKESHDGSHHSGKF